MKSEREEDIEICESLLREFFCEVEKKKVLN